MSIDVNTWVCIPQIDGSRRDARPYFSGSVDDRRSPLGRSNRSLASACRASNHVHAVTANRQRDGRTRNLPSTAIGPSRTSRHVCFCAATGAQADIKRPADFSICPKLVLVAAIGRSQVASSVHSYGGTVSDAAQGRYRRPAGGGLNSRENNPYFSWVLGLGGPVRPRAAGPFY